VNASHLALMALMAQGLSVDPRPNGTIGEPSLRNQKKGSIYLSFYRARAGEGACAISANSAISFGDGIGEGSRSAFLGSSRARAQVMGFRVSAHIAQACARLGVRGSEWLTV
jgi:hypothetical protein